MTSLPTSTPMHRPPVAAAAAAKHTGSAWTLSAATHSHDGCNKKSGAAVRIWRVPARLTVHHRGARADVASNLEDRLARPQPLERRLPVVVDALGRHQLDSRRIHAATVPRETLAPGRHRHGDELVLQAAERARLDEHRAHGRREDAADLPHESEELQAAR
eukprot:2300115-Prymnesium_polylepis.1